MRRANFAYDTSYPGEALPVIRAEFRRLSGVMKVGGTNPDGVILVNRAFATVGQVY